MIACLRWRAAVRAELAVTVRDVRVEYLLGGEAADLVGAVLSGL